MKGFQFKKWLVENDEKTVNLRMPGAAASVQPKPADETPNNGPERTVQYPLGYEPPALISKLHIKNIAKFVEKNIDEYIMRRDSNNINMAQTNFEGTPDYVSPEEAKKLQSPIYERADDGIITTLATLANTVPLTQPMAKRAAIYWMEFKRNLMRKMYESTETQAQQVKNPVIWQVNKIGLTRLENIIGDLTTMMNAAKPSEELARPYANFIKIWSDNYPTWLKIAEDQEKISQRDYKWPSTKVDTGENLPDLW